MCQKKKNAVKKKFIVYGRTMQKAICSDQWFYYTDG